MNADGVATQPGSFANGVRGPWALPGNQKQMICGLPIMAVIYVGRFTSCELNKASQAGMHFGSNCRGGYIKDPEFGDKRPAANSHPCTKNSALMLPLGLKFIPHPCSRKSTRATCLLQNTVHGTAVRKQGILVYRISLVKVANGEPRAMRLLPVVGWIPKQEEMGTSRGCYPLAGWFHACERYYGRVIYGYLIRVRSRRIVDFLPLSSRICCNNG